MRKHCIVVAEPEMEPRDTAWSCKRAGAWNKELVGISWITISALRHSNEKIANRGAMCKVKMVL